MTLAIHAGAKDQELMRTKDRILSQSKLLSEENGLEHWDTPKGSFWIPKGNRYVLPFNLAEMEHKLYGTGTHFVQPGDTVLDCGASDGDFTREALPAGTKEGQNDWKRTGYGGPCPPTGRHRYFHKLYALNTVLTDLGKPTKSQLEKAMAGHVLAQVELMGTYKKAQP